MSRQKKHRHVPKIPPARKWGTAVNSTPLMDLLPRLQEHLQARQARILEALQSAPPCTPIIIYPDAPSAPELKPLGTLWWR